MVDCAKCVNAKNGRCLIGAWYGRNFCYAFEEKTSCEKYIGAICKFIFNGLKILFIGVLIFAAIYISLYIDYHWTKQSLEDLSGKEVKPQTVIWTMIKTDGRK